MRLSSHSFPGNKTGTRRGSINRLLGEAWSRFSAHDAKDSTGGQFPPGSFNNGEWRDGKNSQGLSGYSRNCCW